MIEMVFNTVGMNLLTHEPVIYLKAVEGSSFLPIKAELFESMALNMTIHPTDELLPSTHKLMKTIISELNAQVSSVAITDIKDGVFYAQLSLESGEKKMKFPAAPSDAIALAISTGAPIYVPEAIMLEYGLVEDYGILRPPTEFVHKRDFKEYLENLKPSDFSEAEKKSKLSHEEDERGENK